MTRALQLILCHWAHGSDIVRVSSGWEWVGGCEVGLMVWEWVGGGEVRLWCGCG